MRSTNSESAACPSAQPLAHSCVSRSYSNIESQGTCSLCFITYRADNSLVSALSLEDVIRLSSGFTRSGADPGLVIDIRSCIPL
jgi:hypothetical protein